MAKSYRGPDRKATLVCHTRSLLPWYRNCTVSRIAMKTGLSYSLSIPSQYRISSINTNSLGRGGERTFLQASKPNTAILMLTDNCTVKKKLHHHRRPQCIATVLQ